MLFISRFSFFPLISCFIMSFLIAQSCDQNQGRQSAIIPEEETIAVINNKKITLASFQEKLYAFLQHYRELITTDEEQLGEIKGIVINQLIEEELIAQEASRKGIQVSEEELESNIAESLTSTAMSNIETYFKSSNISGEEWKSRLRKYLVQKKLIKEEVIDKIPITKREIKSYYQKNGKDFTIPQAIKTRNITLSTEDEAMAIHAQLMRRNNFKELIRHHSISPDKLLDGDLGYISKGDLTEEMENEIFKKKFKTFRPKYTDVVRSQDGFHIFRLEKYRPSKRSSLDEARPKIKQILIEQKWDDYYIQWIERLRKEATITIDQAMLQREEGF